MMMNSHDHEDRIELSLTPGQYLRPELIPIRSPHGGGASAPKKMKRSSGISLWDKIFILSCVIAVVMDPLFFYIPIIKEETKCLGKDKNMSMASLVSRFLTDITYLLNIIYQIREAIDKVVVPSNTKKTLASDIETGATSNSESNGGCVKEIARKFNQIKKIIAQNRPLFSLPIFIDFLALLPIPQVLIVCVLFQLETSHYLSKRKILNVLLLGQYVPRIYRIHLSSKEFTKNTRIWVKGAFNFFLYILASHVLRAFWYYFSIQRETSCWHRACLKHKYWTECISIFYCDDHNTRENVEFIKKWCPLKVSDNTTEQLFDFGIFHDSLKTNTGEINFAKKFFYSFWWGLRNLSNFGTNLNTSDYVWENCFAILISVVGLLLFLYLIGNVQTLMQLGTTKSEEVRQKSQMKELDVQVWMERNALPDELKKEITKNIRSILEENKDANLENLFSILPWQTRKSIKRFLFYQTLKKVPQLKNMKAPALKMMCDYLKPVMYGENSYIVRKGEPLNFIVFITQGTVWTYTTRESSDGGAGQLATTTWSSKIQKSLEKCDSYGDEQLLGWASVPNNPFANLPISTENVKCLTKVEGFVLSAKDLSSVASKCKMYWDFGNLRRREHLALCTISAAFLRFRKRTNKVAKKVFPQLPTHDGHQKQRIGYQRLRHAVDLSHLQTR